MKFHPGEEILSANEKNIIYLLLNHAVFAVKCKARLTMLCDLAHTITHVLILSDKNAKIFCFHHI